MKVLFKGNDCHGFAAVVIFCLLEGFDVALFPEPRMDPLLQGAGPPSVDHADGIQVRKQRVVKIFVELRRSFVHVFPDEIDLGGDAGGLSETGGEAGAAGLAPLAGPVGAVFPDGDDIVHADLGAQDAHAHVQLAVLVRKGGDDGVVVHAQDADIIPDLQLQGLVALHRCLGALDAALRLHGLQAFAKLCPLFFQLPHQSGVAGQSVDLADRGIRSLLGFRKDALRFLPRLFQDLFLPLVQVLVAKQLTTMSNALKTLKTPPKSSRELNRHTQFKQDENCAFWLTTTKSPMQKLKIWQSRLQNKLKQTYAIREE